MLPFFVYILKCNDDSYYTGHTDNLESRISAHKQGKGGFYTSERLPVEVVYTGLCGSRYEAIANERKIKSWSRTKKEAFIRGDEEAFVRICREEKEKKNIKKNLMVPQDFGTNG